MSSDDRKIISRHGNASHRKICRPVFSAPDAGTGSSVDFSIRTHNGPKAPFPDLGTSDDFEKTALVEAADLDGPPNQRRCPADTRRSAVMPQPCKARRDHAEP